MITSLALVAAARTIAEKHKTVYGWGTFGNPVTKAKIAEKVGRYPNYYPKSKQDKLAGLIGKAFLFDCVGLIKAILWGWTGDMSKPNGGLIYQSNGVADMGAGTMFSLCKDQSADFSKIEPGCVVYLPGHIGIYIGDNKVVEATPSWDDGVQVTYCWNLVPGGGGKGRRWDKHGKLPWVEYVPEVELPPIPKTIVPTLVHALGTPIHAFVLDGVTYARVRSLATACGLKTDYNAETKQTILRR